MFMYLKLAWRNLWRNRGRTLITAASVFFAIILVLFTRSMQLGTYDHVIMNTLKLSTGFIQVQGEGFWDKRSLNNSMPLNDSLLRELRGIEHVTMAVPRLESFALGSSGDNTRGVMVTGIAPELEDEMNDLSDRVVKGSYIQPDSQGVVVGQNLAEYLNLGVGDSLVLLSQGYHGVSAAGIFVVTGIVDLSIPELDNRMVYMPLATAQWFFSMPQRVTSLAIMIDDPENLGSIKEQVADYYTNGYDVMNWREMVPELVQSIEIDNAGGIIMLGILYLVIGFGIFGTVMMMVVERRKEFAILLSVGMKRWRMGFIVLLETVTIGVLGTALGALVAIPVLLYMRANPIRLTGGAAEAMMQYGYEPLIPFQVEPDLFINQAIVVFIISLIATSYPLWTILRFKIAEALHA